MAITEYNVDLDVKGKVLATTVPNSTGSIVTWNSSTNVFGLRTNAEIIADLNLSSNFVPYTGATANVNLNGKILTNSTIRSGVTSLPAIPASGVGGHHFEVGNSTSTVYGMLFGSLGNGQGYIQQGRTDGNTTNYQLNLNPNGGVVRTGDNLVAVGAIQSNNYFLSTRLGYFGTYNQNETQGIWSISSTQNVFASTTTLGNQYGLAYSYNGVGGSSVTAGHQIHFVHNGTATATVVLGSGIFRSSGGFVKVGQDNTQMLLAAGGHRPVSDFALAGSLDNYLPTAGGTMNTNAVINWAGGQAYLQYGGNNRLRITANQTIISGGHTGTNIGIYLRPQGDAIATDQVTIDGNGLINTSNHGNSSQWKQAFDWGDFRQFGLGTYTNNNPSIGDANITSKTMFFSGTTTTLNKPDGSGHTYLQISRATTISSQIAFDYDSDRIHVRRFRSGIWHPWVEFIHTGNISSSLSGYVPTSRTLTAGNGLSGGGDLTVNRTFTLGTPSSVGLTSTNSVTTSSHTHALDASTITAINQGVTANTWGDHASAGYALASQLSGYVPTSRTLTINGTTLDLSADRTWTIPDNDTITRLRGTASGTFTSGDLTLLAGANTTITQSGANITIASTNTNTTYSAGNGLTLSGTTFSLPVTDSGSGNYVSNVVASASGLTVTKATLPIPSLVTSTTTTGTSNVTTTNTNTYLNIVSGGTSTGSSTQVTGAGSVTVSSDTAGKLTITGTDTNTTYTAGTGLSLTGTVFGQTITTNGTGSFVTGITQTTNGFQVNLGTPPNTTYSAGTGLSLTGTTFANTAPNATHTGDVTGATALTIANSAVTHAKYQNIPTQRILGRGATGTGNVQELTLGANLSLSTTGILSATNTTYTAGTLAILNTGTSATNQLWSSLILNQWINGKNFTSQNDLVYKWNTSQGHVYTETLDWQTNLAGKNLQGLGNNITYKGEYANLIGFGLVGSGKYQNVIGNFNVNNGVLSNVYGNYNSSNASLVGLFGNFLYTEQQGQSVYGNYNKFEEPENEESLRKIHVFASGKSEYERDNAVEIFADNSTNFRGRAKYDLDTRNEEWFQEENTLVDVRHTGMNHLPYNASSSTPDQYNFLQIVVRTNAESSTTTDVFRNLTDFSNAYNVYGICQGSSAVGVDQNIVHTKGSIEFNDLETAYLFLTVGITTKPYLVVMYEKGSFLGVRYMTISELISNRRNINYTLILLGNFILGDTAVFEFNQQIL